MNHIRTRAIILRRTNYGEADRIIYFLTPESGTLSAIAKGVRREKSKLAGGLELFAVCEVTILSGRGELGIVSSARLEHFYGRILYDYARLQLGYETIKQVARAVETVAEPAFFELLRRTFDYLDDEQIAVSLVEIWFRLQLAILLGIGLNVSTDINGMKLVEDTAYRFDIEHMAFAYDDHGPLTTHHIKLLRLLSVKDPKTLSRVSGIEPLLETCLGLVRVATE